MKSLEPSRAKFVAGIGAAVGAAVYATQPAEAQTAPAPSATEVPTPVPTAPPPPPAVTPAPTPRDLETPIEYLNTWITPNDLHFVRSHYGPPQSPDLNAWRLSIKGDVGNALSLSIFDLRTQFEAVSETVLCQCAGNGRGLFSPRASGAQWTYGGVGNARWTGVRLSDILDRAKMDPNTKFLVTMGADHPANPNAPQYVRAFPIDKALDKYTILAYDMNGEPLPLLHGSPLRLIAPGWTGNHWLKWLTSLEARVNGAPEDVGFWVATAYRIPNNPATPGVPVLPADTHVVAQMSVKSEILAPLDGDVVRSGSPLFVQGVAWSGVPSIRSVDISIDGGPWHPATLGDALPYAWRRFSYVFTPSDGTHVLAARATDETGATQPLVGVWNPAGYLWNGIMRVSITARSA
ncbi:MAG TPA: sulfite oxidase [Candidatus Baltobacteraceae bacterium]